MVWYFSWWFFTTSLVGHQSTRRWLVCCYNYKGLLVLACIIYVYATYRVYRPCMYSSARLSLRHNTKRWIPTIVAIRPRPVVTSRRLHAIQNGSTIETSCPVVSATTGCSEGRAWLRSTYAQWLHLYQTYNGWCYDASEQHSLHLLRR